MTVSSAVSRATTSCSGFPGLLIPVGSTGSLSLWAPPGWQRGALRFFPRYLSQKLFASLVLFQLFFSSDLTGLETEKVSFKMGAMKGLLNSMFAASYAPKGVQRVWVLSSVVGCTALAYVHYKATTNDSELNDTPGSPSYHFGSIESISCACCFFYFICLFFLCRRCHQAHPAVRRQGARPQPQVNTHTLERVVKRSSSNLFLFPLLDDDDDDDANNTLNLKAKQ
jgi:hypothetical protein